MSENQTREMETPGLDPMTNPEPSPSQESLPEDVRHAFERLETLLKKIHGSLDARAREREHRDWAYLRTVAVILQILVAGLMVLALFDWILYGPVNTLIVKLAFAGVLQITSLTAFIISGKKE